MPATDPMLTTWPPSRRCGRQRRVIRIRPWTFVSSTTSSSASVESSNGIAPEGEAGVVDEDVEASERVDGSSDEALAALGVGDVELERDVRLQPVDAPRAARDPDALGTQRPRDRRADPARSAGDDRGLAFELHRASLTGELDQSGRVLDLEGRVGQLEAVAQEHLQLAPDRMAVGPGRDEHVRRQGREA